MHVDELLAVPEMSATAENQWQSDPLIIPKDWAQGRTAFGGISAGMAYQAISTQVHDDRVLRSYTTNFVGPLLLNDVNKPDSGSLLNLLSWDFIYVFSTAFFSFSTFFLPFRLNC